MLLLALLAEEREHLALGPLPEPHRDPVGVLVDGQLAERG